MIRVFTLNLAVFYNLNFVSCQELFLAFDFSQSLRYTWGSIELEES